MQKGYVSKKVLLSSSQKTLDNFIKRIPSKSAAVSKPSFHNRPKSNINDENIDCSNIDQNRVNQKISAGITKRIKKAPISIRNSVFLKVVQEYKPVFQIPNQQGIKNNQLTVTIENKTFRCYPEQFLQIPDHFRQLSLPHTQDNDCDSDWDQVQAGAYKLFRSFKEAIAENRQI